MPKQTQTHLPWWAIVLPALAFAALLTLVAAPGQGGPSAAEPVAYSSGGSATQSPLFCGRRCDLSAPRA